MTTLREAAQQALEALERADKDDFWREQHAAITALRAALADGDNLSPTEPVAWLYKGNLHAFDPSGWCIGLPTPLYTHPPQRKPQAEGKPWRCSCGANLYIDAEGNPRSKA